MTNELMIGDRAAVPLRLLPFASMWLTPQTIVTALARHAGQFSLTAFHLHAGKATQIPRARWDDLKTQLLLLEDKMQRKEDFEDQNFDKWQRKSLKLIPPGVFLWKDELINAFEAEFSNRDDEDDRPSYYGPCEGDNELQLECHLTATDRDFVFAEFEQARLLNDNKHAEPGQAKDTTGMRAGVKRAILEHWPSIMKLHPSGPDTTQVWRYINRKRDSAQREWSKKTVTNSLGTLRKDGLIP